MISPSVGGWENWATPDYAATRTFGVGILNARFLIPKLNSCGGSVIFDRLNMSRYFRGAGGRSSNGRRPCASRTATCPTIIRCRRAWRLGKVFAWTARSCSRHRAHSRSPSWKTRSLRRRDRPPTRLVVGPALVLAEEVARLEMREEMDQAHLAPHALDLADRGAHRRLVRRSVGEEPPELRLGLEQPSALRAGFGK